MLNTYYSRKGQAPISVLILAWLLLAGTSLHAQQTLVKDILPGSGSSNPASIASIGSTIYFSASNGSSGAELWKSDGTASGTVLVKDINPGASSSNPLWLVNLNGTLFFTATDGIHGTELWKSNGTAAGTVLVKDITTGAEGGYFEALTVSGGRVYFSYNNHLWQSNGLASGTIAAKDANEFSPFDPTYLTDVNGTLFFRVIVDRDSYNYELWKTNGTQAGTMKVETEWGFTDEMTDFINANGILYFLDFQGRIWSIWRSDGTANGTYTIADIGTRFEPGRELINVNGTLYFISRGNTLSKYNWTTDEVEDLLYTEGDVPAIRSLTNLNGILYFIVHDWLWKCEGNGITVSAVKELNLPFQFTSSNGKLYFTDFSSDSTTSSTLWVSDGTAAGTRAVEPATGAPTNPFDLVNANGVLYYSAATPSQGRELWRNAPAPVISKSFRVNAGGNAFSTIDARSFTADAYFSGGAVSSATTKDIVGTDDDYLYQTGRHGTSFTYNFPTGNGSYDVVLHFAETYFGNTAPGGIGSRKFHVNMEGVRKLTDYDVFARAKGALRVAQETFRVNVADGTLNVAFLKGTADNPAIKAIEVLPAGSALTINSGGGVFTSNTGKKFSPDSYYASGSISSITSGEIANTTDDALYRNARVGVFSYGLPSGNGTFDVTLHFAETYFGSRTTGGVGSRKFNVFVENVKRLSDYDIFAKAGGAMRARKETIRVTVSDGVLNLYFAKGTADNPAVSAIEVVRAPVAARFADGAVEAEDWNVTLYPNPVADRLTVKLPFSAVEVEATTITDAAGNIRLMNAHKVSGENEMQINVGVLPRGLYLLNVNTQNGHMVLKFAKR